MRAQTLAQHARVLAGYTDRIVDAVHTGDLDVITRVRDQVRQLLPPHGFDPADALLVVLAAQIDPRIPVETRLAWVRDFDPARLESVA